MKQLDPQLVFELPDLMAQRRLAQIQPLGGAAEVQRLGQRDDVAKVAQFHAGGEAYSFPPVLASPLC